MQSVPWSADDLHAIARKNDRSIKVGLQQLERAGLLDKRPSGHYRTPTTISDFAFEQLVALGGEQLVAATTVLRANDILQKADLVLRYMRQSMIKESLRDKENQSLLENSITEQFSHFLPDFDYESEEDSMLAILRDPLLDYFENVILNNQTYIDRWLDMLTVSNFSLLRHQLEETFNWAHKQEDWALLRRFATGFSVNTDWIIDTEFIGEEGAHDWLQINMVFPLLKHVEIENYELVDVVLIAPNIKLTTWQNCQFVATQWPAAYVISSTFAGNDMVGLIAPGGVFTDCEFIDIDARYGDFRGTTFQKCSFENVNFRGAKLEKAKFIDCYFDHVDMRMTSLESALPHTH